MRKYFLYLGLIFAVSLTLYSCLRDRGYEGRDGSDGTFDVSAAKKFFDKEIGSASVLDLGRPGAATTRSSDNYAMRLYDPSTRPDWGQARAYKTGDVSVVEVHLDLKGRIQALIKRNTREVMTNEKSNITSILLLRKKGEVTVSLVATIMPDKDYARSRPADAGPYWLDRLDRGFTGKVFYSAVNGRMIVGHVYENGQIVNDLVLRSKLLQHRHHDCDCNCDGSCGEACDCGCGGKCEGDCDHDHATEATATKAGSAANLEILGYMTVTLADRTMATRWNGGTYWNEWEDDMWGCPGCSDRNCVWCMDSIVVIGHQPDYCFWCGNDPCTCYNYSCSYCGSSWCSGDCQGGCTYCGDRYCSGECQNKCRVCWNNPCTCPCPDCGNPFCRGECRIIPPGLQPDPIDVMKVDIQRDCMGPTLIETCNATGVTISFSNTRPPGHELYEGFYYPSTNTITMYEKDKDYVLLEEMIHNYQRAYRDSNEPYYQGNNEIEAKLLVWEYCKRTGQAEFLKYLSPNGWGKFALFAENPTEANWGSAKDGLFYMGYPSSQFPVSEYNNFKTDNYRKLTCH